MKSPALICRAAKGGLFVANAGGFAAASAVFRQAGRQRLSSRGRRGGRGGVDGDIPDRGRAYMPSQGLGEGPYPGARPGHGAQQIDAAVLGGRAVL